jgi:hypothetical protein
MDSDDAVALVLVVVCWPLAALLIAWGAWRKLRRGPDGD